MARRSKDSDEMSKDEVVQTRISTELKNQLKNQKDDNQTLADHIRTILDGVAGKEALEGASIKAALLCDLYSLISSVPGQDSIPDVLDQHWDTLTATELREETRPQLLDPPGAVYIAGQGSSYAVGSWFAASLQERGVDASIHPAEDIPVRALDADDILILLSYTGQTRSITELADRAVNRDATLIGVSTDPSRINRSLDYHIELPPIEERVDSYATRSVILQMAALQTSILADNPTRDAVQAVFNVVDRYVHDQLASEDPPDRNAVIEVDDQPYYLSDDSPYARAATVLHDDNSLAADPIVASLGPYNVLGWIGVQSHTDFLHTTAGHVDLGSVRDRVVNVLYHGDAYLVATIPDQETDWYDRSLGYLFQHEDSIANLLRYPQKSRSFRVLAFTFNDRDAPIETDIRRMALYGEDGLFRLPDPGDEAEMELDAATAAFGRDVMVAVAQYLLVYAILEERWDQDQQLRQEITRGPEL